MSPCLKGHVVVALGVGFRASASYHGNVCEVTD